MAKQNHTASDETVTVANPLPFRPDNFYTDRELAAKFKISLRTIVRWRSQGMMGPKIALGPKSTRTLGAAANALWQSKVPA